MESVPKLRDFEISDELTTVVGRLKKHSKFWKETLKPTSFIQNVVDFGYFIPFTSPPPAFAAKNNASSLRHSDFVEKAISTLLENSCIVELNSVPYCCNPLTVAERPKLRLVIDLRHVNKYVIKNKFRYEDLKTLSELFEQNDYFTKFDLKSGYHHVQMHELHHKFLGFCWTFKGGATRYFQFVVLPFGLSSACYVFTKIIRPLVTKWRGQGLKSIVFVDDGITGHSDFRSAKMAAEIVRNDLLSAGFVINTDKSDFNPTQVGSWLGTIIDTKTMIFSVPEKKITKLLTLINKVLSQKFSSAKQLSKIAGHLSSMHMSIGPMVRLFTRALYKDIENRTSWHSSFVISTDSVSELQFWSLNLVSQNGFTFKHYPTTTKIVFTDASDKGYGGFICEKLDKIICVGKFLPCEENSSSTFRELLAV